MSQSGSQVVGRPALPPPAIASLGGRYRLDEPLRAVDGAALWRGTDAVLSRPVTIWELRPDRPVPLEVIAAVLGAARLSDPRFARIFDADCASERPYIVTEWVPGSRLDELLSAGLPGVWTAVGITVEVAGAMAAAHRAGLAHLCLTPGSVQRGGNGLKVTGLGVEAALSGAADPDPAGADTRALGGLLYALLTGYWPGALPCLLPAAPRYRGDLCPPTEVRAGIPDAIGAIVTRALRGGDGRRGERFHGDQSGEPVRTPDQLASELRRVRRLLRPLGPRPREAPAAHPRAIPAQPIAREPGQVLACERPAALTS